MTIESRIPSTFKALLITQFFGALNDNLFKFAVSIAAVTATTSGGENLGLSQALFVLPFILFVALAGWLNDKFSKVTIIRASKIFELLLSVASAHFLLTNNFVGLLSCLFLFGTHSALSGPARYGLIPQYVGHEAISRANGFMECVSFLAIIAGSALGSFLLAHGNTTVSVSFIIFAACGVTASSFLKNPNASLLVKSSPSNTLREIKEIFADRGLRLVVSGISAFWFIASLFYLNTLLYASQAHYSEIQSGILVTTLAIGIGLGSLIAGKISEGKVELGLVPLGVGVLTIGCFAISILFTSYLWAIICLFVCGLSSGAFLIPLQSYLQSEAPKEKLGSYLAIGNLFSNLATLASAGTFYLLSGSYGIHSSHIFLVITLICIGLSSAAFRLLPEMFLRCVNWILTHTFYRITLEGAHHIPKTGGGLIVANHIAYCDPSLILASVQRPIRFIMYRPIYEAFGLHYFAKTLKAIPISPSDGPKELVKSFSVAREAIKNGELVCIFAEGQLTRIGNLLPFSRGLERIMEGVDAPIIPIHLDSVWGSIFSHRGGKVFQKLPSQIPYPVSITIGAPLPGQSTSISIRNEIQRLGTAAFAKRPSLQPLSRLLLKSIKSRPNQKLITESSGRSINARQFLAASIALSRIFKKSFAQEDAVGILLPPSIGGALANAALTLVNKTTININYTLSEDSITSICHQGKLKHIITSKLFAEKLKITLPAQSLFMEELQEKLSIKSIWLDYLVTYLPRSVIELMYGYKRHSLDSTATIMFSSGSTGEPKGVMLSHRNIGSNIIALSEVFQLSANDCVLGVLPFFHSFGFTGTLWLPLLTEARAVYHFNPLDSSTVGKLIAEQAATILLATPTFLSAYMRKCTPEQFSTLEHIVVGAEKLKPELAKEFEKKYNAIPFEGYGCTELSPVAVLNVANRREPGIKQIGNKLGSVGHPLPGVSARVVDPESFVPKNPNEEGLLLISGPNVMQGYLGNPQKTAEVIKDGWYITGDIAKIDEDGFVTITDRLSRFSKIGGEMVPHIKIEEVIHRCLQSTEQRAVVTAVPDEKKGERLAVLYTGTIDIDALLTSMSEAGIPNLWIPKRDAFIAVTEFPILGSGKLDLKKIKAMALQKP